MQTTTLNQIPIINYVIFFAIIALYVLQIASKWKLMESTIGSGSDSPSQKRLTIFFCTQLLIVLSLCAVLLKLSIPDFVWAGIIGIIAAGLGLSVLEKVKMNNPTTGKTDA